MNQPTKSILVTGLVFLIYGYLCRLLNLYFFWDAKTIGWILLFVALLLYWIDLRRKRKRQGKKIIWVTIGVCVLTFGLALLLVIVIIFHNTEAYHAATEYVKSNPKIKEQIGEVKSFGLIPTGTVQTTATNGVESGNAVFEMTVNGSKKNMDLVIELTKEPNNEWAVNALR